MWCHYSYTTNLDEETDANSDIALKTLEQSPVTFFYEKQSWNCELAYEGPVFKGKYRLYINGKLANNYKIGLKHVQSVNTEAVEIYKSDTL